jgi:hypothetical protein
VKLRAFRSFVTLGSLWLLLLASGVALAAGEKDKEALKIHDSAMNDDYLSTEFGKADKKLRDALKRCGANGCTPAVVGRINMSLGTVLGVGLDKMDAAKDAFRAALKADPNAQLDKSLATPELTAAFNEVKGGAKPEKPEKPAGKAPGGDLSHTPVTEQSVNTPVPVYIEVPADLDAKKVTLRYKPFGGTAWKTIEMKKVGEGFGAEVPCDDVTTTGEIKYYISALDGSGSAIATAGTLKEPYKVMIKNEIEGEAPHLPGKKAPKACVDRANCPPGLPGCPEAKRGEKDVGGTCDTTTECKEGLACMNGTCVEDKDSPATGAGKRNLITLGVALDLMLIKSGERVCSGNAAEYACFYQDNGQQFYGDPSNAKNAIQSGFGLGGGRVLVSYDRQIFKNLGLAAGVRLGFAFGGSPGSDRAPPNALHDQAKSFLPFHAEGRVSYYFGGSLYEGGKFRPFAFVGGGLAQVNAGVPVSVCDRLDRDGRTPAPASDYNCPEGAPTGVGRDLDAYQITGLNFIGFGGGATYGITKNFGIAAEVKVMLMLPTFGVVFSPSLGPAVAF